MLMQALDYNIKARLQLLMIQLHLRLLQLDFNLPRVEIP